MIYPKDITFDEALAIVSPHLISITEAAQILGLTTNERVRQLVRADIIKPRLTIPNGKDTWNIFSRGDVEHLRELREKYPTTGLGPHPWSPPGLDNKSR